jgi:Uma2 family endonuclease
MTAVPKDQLPAERMTVDEFIAWSQTVPGRYELHAGIVYKMQAERAGHVRKKVRVQQALRAALDKAGKGASCEALADGVVVRIDAATGYEPDAVVYCGPRMSDEEIEVPNPVIVVEVVSPSSGQIDTGEKLAAYFSVPTVSHYLIVNNRTAVVTHHQRQADGAISARIIGKGTLTLIPPGISFEIEQLFSE